MTYADIARELNLSEASIKRLFADGGFTLARMEQVCHLAGLGLSDLVELSQQQRARLDQLTLEQESEIAEDILLLLVAVCVINGYRFDELIADYQLSEHDCIQKLAKLDRLKIIDLLPGNRIKLRISPNFRWNANGPIQQFFLKKVQQDFFNSQFDKEDEKLLVLNGLFSAAGNSDLQQKIDALAEEFHQLIKQSRTLPMEKKHGTTLVVALRHWRYNLFEKLSRTKKS